MSLASLHSEPSGTNEHNPGLGFAWERDLGGGWTGSLEAGAFRNSWEDVAPYGAAALHYEAGWVRPGIALVGAGYEQGLLGGPTLCLELGPEWLRARALWIPDVGQDGGHVVGLGFTIPLQGD